MWTDAFLIYTSIYCTIHVLRLQELLKYMQTIRLGAKRNAGFRWKLYDEQFRLRKAQEPASSWAIIDTELWLLYMQPSAGAGNELGLQGAPRQTQNNKSFKCYAFNYNGVCTQQYCNFKHSCLKCSGVHPVISCTNNVQAVGNNPQSPGIAQRFQTPRARPLQKTQSRFQTFAPRHMQNNPRFRSPGIFMGQEQNANQN